MSRTAEFRNLPRWAFPALFFAPVGIAFLLLGPALLRLAAGGLVRDVNSFDYSIIEFLNSFARRSWTIDTWFYLIDSNPLFTAPVLMAFWWAWFKKGVAGTQDREFLLLGIINSFIAPSIARALALSLPYRERPLHNALLHFQLPYNMNSNRVIGWSSFPSDHAAMWFALVVSIFFVSRRLGTFLSIYVVFTLCTARMYLGIHYPTDILVGALIGIAVALLTRITIIRSVLTTTPLRWVQQSPAIFYAVLFLLTDQMAEGFASLHDVESLVRATMTSISKVV